MSSTIEGELQSLGGEGFEGWAWDSLKPYDPVEIELLCNDTVIASALADKFSLDLVKQRKGNGMHAFTAMPRSFPKVQFPLKIWARVRGHEEALSGAIDIKNVDEFVGLLPKSLLQDFEGYVDGIRDGFIVGWVRNAAIPDESVEVELRDGDNVILTAMANHYRADVEQQLPGSGDSGFELELPYHLLDGQLHNLSVRVAGTNYELGNSPISFGPGAYNILVKELLRLRELVHTQESRIQEFSRVLMARFEALYTAQRDAFERELQAIKTAALGFPRLAEPQEPLGAFKTLTALGATISTGPVEVAAPALSRESAVPTEPIEVVASPSSLEGAAGPTATAESVSSSENVVPTEAAELAAPASEVLPPIVKASVTEPVKPTDISTESQEIKTDSLAESESPVEASTDTEAKDEPAMSSITGASEVSSEEKAPMVKSDSKPSRRKRG